MSTEVRAQNDISLASVKQIKDASAESQAILAGMRQSAIDAGTTLNGIYQDAENASEYASRALGNLSTVQSVTEALNWITQHGTMTLTTDTALDPTHVYFVADAQGDYVVGGNHYSIVNAPDVADISTYYELSINESLNNYVATHLAVDSEGLWIIPDAGGNKVLLATGQGSTYSTAGTYIIGKVNGVDTVFAKFLKSGATITTENGTQIAQLGYGQGQGESGMVTAPYYTLGIRASGSTVGAYSLAEGDRTIASDFCAHAEGYRAEATGQISHAESRGKARGVEAHAENAGSAIGFRSHAEGTGVADNDYTHAEGYLSYANAPYSHVNGLHVTTKRTNEATTCIGKYNDPKDDTAFEIGNGADTSNKSNALEVTWDGNIRFALPDYQTASSTDKAIYDAITALGWDNDVLS